jgi:hypothetical protein
MEGRKEKVLKGESAFLSSKKKAREPGKFMKGENILSI